MKKVIRVMAAVAALFAALQSEAQEVKYCKNYTSGEVIVVQAGMPCPYPTVEL